MPDSNRPIDETYDAVEPLRKSESETSRDDALSPTVDSDAQAHQPDRSIEITIQSDEGAPRILTGDGALPLREHKEGDRFKLNDEISRGGMGAVFFAVDRDLNREIAVKVMLVGKGSQEGRIARFVEEAQVAGQLQHPGIPPIYELGRFEDGRLFFAMKLVRGQTLRDTLGGRSDLRRDQSSLLGIFEQICQTLAFAHRHGVIHRDLKPANVMVGAFGEVQVMDWGLAKILGTSSAEDLPPEDTEFQQVVRSIRSDDSSRTSGTSEHTQLGSVLGTLAYMSPEQANGRTDLLDCRSDVFGLGAILCEILTGHGPYLNDANTSVLTMAQRGDLSPAFERLDACQADPELVLLTKECLAPNQDDRPSDASVLAQKITGHLESVASKLESARQEKLISDAKATEESKRRKLLLALAGTVISFVGLGAVGWMASQYRQTQLANDKASLLIQKVADAGKIQKQNEQIVAANETLAAETKRAEAAQREAVLTLADMQTSQGIFAARAGQSDQSPLWFCASAKTARDDDRRHQLALTRARNWGYGLPTSIRYRELPFAGTRVQSFAFQPIGTLLLIQRHGGLIVWDWNADETVGKDFGEVTSAAWSPDGGQLVTVDLGGAVRSWSTDDWTESNLINEGAKANNVIFSRDGRSIAVASRPVHWIDVQSGKVVSLDDTDKNSVYSIAFSVDGSELLVAAKDRKVRAFQFDPATSEKTIAASREINSAHSCSSSRPLIGLHDDSMLMVSSSGEYVRVDGDRLITLFGESPTKLFASPAGNKVVAKLRTDAQLFQFDQPATDSLRRVPSNPIVHKAMEVFEAAFSGNDEILLTVGNDQMARLWNTATGEPLYPPIAHPAGVVKGAIDSLGFYFATIDSEGKLRVFENPSKQQPTRIGKSFTGRGHLSKDGRYVIPVQWHQDPWSSLGGTNPTIYDLHENAKPVEIEVPGRVVDTEITADGKSVIAIHEINKKGFVSFGDIASDTSLDKEIELLGVPLAVDSHPQAKEAAVLVEGGRVNIIDLESGKSRLVTPIADWNASFRAWPTLKYSPDGKKLLVLTGGDSNRIEVLDPQNGQRLFDPILPIVQGGPCRGFVISPSQKRLATFVNGQNAAQVWDLENGQPLSPPLLHTGDGLGLYCVAFTQDENRLITGSRDGQVRIWDYEQGILAGATLQHDDEVFAMELTPNGETLIVGGRDGQVHFWDLPSGTPIAPPIQLDHSVIALAVTADGQALVITTDSRTDGGTKPSLFRIGLRRLLDRPEHNIDALKLQAEVVSHRRIANETSVILDAQEWADRFEELQTSALQRGDLSQAEFLDRVRGRLESALESSDGVYVDNLLKGVARRFGHEQSQKLAASIPESQLLPCLTALVQRSGSSSGIAFLDRYAQSAGMERRKGSPKPLTEASGGKILSEAREFLSCELPDDRKAELLPYLVDLSSLIPVFPRTDADRDKRLADVNAISKHFPNLTNHDRSTLNLLAARVHYSRSDLPQAYEACEKAIAFDANDIGNWLIMGAVYRRANDLDNAIRCYTRCTELEPTKAYWLTLVETQLMDLQLEEAISTIKKGTPHYLSLKRSLESRSKYIARTSNDSAAMWYKAMLQAYPNEIQYRKDLVTALYRAGRFQECFDMVELGVSEAQTSPLLNYYAVLALNRMDRFADAESAALNGGFYGDRTQVIPQLVTSLIEQGRAEDAKRELGHLDRSSSLYQFYRGWIELANGNYANCRDILGEYISTRSASSQAKEILGEAIMLGKLDPMTEVETEALAIARVLYDGQLPDDEKDLSVWQARCHRLNLCHRAYEISRALLPELKKTAKDYPRGEEYDAACSAFLSALKVGDAKSLNEDQVKDAIDYGLKALENNLKQIQPMATSDDQYVVADARKILDRWIFDEDIRLIRSSKLDSIPEEFRDRVTSIWETVHHLRRHRIQLEKE